MALLLKAPVILGSSAFRTRGQRRRYLSTSPSFPRCASIRAEADRSSAGGSLEVCENAKLRREPAVVESPSDPASDSPRSLFAVAAQHCAILIATGALVMSPALVADAAQGGGRVGGQAFQKSRAAPPPPRPRTQIRSNTNIYVAPPVVVAPPVYGGGFFSPPPFFGGWGYSPYVVTPGPSVAIGVGGGGIGFFFNFFFFAIIAGVLFNIVRGLSRRDDDDRY